MPKSVEQLALAHLRKSELAREERAESGQAVVNPVITISRSMGSGGLITAQILADDLGFSLWDRELIDAMAGASQMPPEIVQAFDERTHSDVELFILACLGKPEMSGFLYLKHLTRIVAAIASVGNAIILGRGVNFLIPNALNVRMDASIKCRVLNMVEFENLDRQTAEEKIRRSDREREQYLISLFGKERARSFNYDISLWMDKLTPACAAEMIKTAYKGFYQSK